MEISKLKKKLTEAGFIRYDTEIGNVDVYMSRLRKKVDEGFDTKLIHTIRGAGWVLREEV